MSEIYVDDLVEKSNGLETRFSEDVDLSSGVDKQTPLLGEDWRLLDGRSKKRCIVYTSAVKTLSGEKPVPVYLQVDESYRIRRPYATSLIYSGGNRRVQLLRNLVVVLDWSEGMAETDYKPTRAQACVDYLTGDFVTNFFENNPVSSLSIVATLDRNCVSVCALSSNSTQVVTNLRSFADEQATQGDPSIQAGLERAIRMLEAAPAHSFREILVIYGSCHTLDSGDLSVTTKALKDANIQVNAVSLAPEIHVLKVSFREHVRSSCLN